MFRKLYLISLLALLAFLFRAGFCTEVTEQRVITDFSKTHEIILEPKKNETYTTYRVTLFGPIDDSLTISIQGRVHAIAGGHIEFTETHDYYGSIPFTVRLSPYKATAGSLKIEASIF